MSSVAYASPYADLALRWRELTSQIDRRWEQLQQWMDESERLYPAPEVLRATQQDLEVFGFSAALPTGKAHLTDCLHQFAGPQCRPPGVGQIGGRCATALQA